LNLAEIGTYDRVAFTLKSQGNMAYRGQFRGRIKDTDHVYYDKQGSAIWVTSDNGFEIMADIEDISTIEVVEKYN
jgi:hypothetical protein